MSLAAAQPSESSAIAASAAVVTAEVTPGTSSVAYKNPTPAVAVTVTKILSKAICIALAVSPVQSFSMPPAAAGAATALGPAPTHDAVFDGLRCRLLAFDPLVPLRKSRPFASPLVPRPSPCDVSARRMNRLVRSSSPPPPFSSSSSSSSSLSLALAMFAEEGGGDDLSKGGECKSGADPPKEDANASPPPNPSSTDGIDLSSDSRLYRVRLSRAPGIEWGTDLSFSFVYVRALEPAGPASLGGEVKVGDQICELRAVSEADDSGGKGASSPSEPINLIGAPFDSVMGSFASLGKSVRDVDLVFFRGTKDELKAACGGTRSTEEDEYITITVVQNKGSKDEVVREVRANRGCNVRQALVDEGINVYQSITRWTNCKGKQLCGTCIVNVPLGGLNTNRKSMDEASTLRENPDTYRLSCVTFAYGDCVVETFPPIEASQWTR